VTQDKIDVGRQGEDAAVHYLQAHGYRIVARNFRNRLGEIDIVALHKGTICFVEVRTRQHVASHVMAYESVGSLKQRQLSKLAISFLKENNGLSKKARFDVVSVILSGTETKVSLIQDAFPVIEKYR
jgi:putative endonuclease